MAMDRVEAIDQWAVTFVNSFHTPFLDEVMWLISAKLTWIPLYLLLIYLYGKSNNFKRTFFFVATAIAVVAIADQVSVHLFKNIFMRYRPSHHTLLSESLHLYQFEDGSYYKGGMYGFVSSHAANFFGVLTFAVLVLRDSIQRIGWFVLPIACIVSLSRVYLGVHYCSDVFVGGLLGVLIAFIIYKFVFVPLQSRKFLKQ